VLYTHRNPAMTAKYFVSFRGRVEEQKSSGIWVGPAAGSTAAIHSAGGKRLPARSKLIQFVVREPYFPQDDHYVWNHGFVKPGEAVEVWNKMKDAALYVDGPRAVVPLDVGERVRFDLSPEPLTVLGFSPGRPRTRSAITRRGSGTR
jgi:NAD+ kinase